MWFAKDSTNKYTTIEQIQDSNRNDTYLCPVCGSMVIPKLGDKNSHHFAHVDKSKCNTESLIHWCYKNNFLIAGTKFYIFDKESSTYKEYVCKEVDIEKTYHTSFGLYRPDVTVRTESGEEIFLEMFYKNKKNTDDYINLWCELNKPVIEIDIKALLHYEEDYIYRFNPVFYNGICYKHKMSKSKSFQNLLAMKTKVLDLKTCNVNNNAVQIINNIDWFWNDLLRYKSGDIEISEIAISLNHVMDCLDTNLSHMVEDFLINVRCSKILEEYRKYNFKKYNDYIEKSVMPLLVKEYNQLPEYLKWCDIEVDSSYRFGGINVTQKNISFYGSRRLFNNYISSDNYMFDENSKENFVSQIIEYIKNEYEKIVENCCKYKVNFDIGINFPDVELNLTTDTPVASDFYLSSYNFSLVNNEIEEIQNLIALQKERKLKELVEDVKSKQKSIDEINDECLTITDIDITNKLKNLLNSILFCMSKQKRDTIFILLNWKFYTSDSSQQQQLIKFVRNLRSLGLRVNRYSIVKNY